MAKVKIGIRKDAPVEKKQEKLDGLATNLAGKPQFASVNPPVAALTTLSAAITVKLSEIWGTEAALAQLFAQLQTLGNQAYERIVAVAADVQNISNGDAAAILSTGFGVADEGSPIGLPAAPQNLHSRPSEIEGTALLGWKRVFGAMSYIVECTQNPVTGPWVFVGVATKASFLATGLQSGTKYWFRVRAVGAAGEGPNSDPAVKMAA